MTAAEVNGVKVIGDFAAQSPLVRKGIHVYYKQIRRLVLEDGTEIYGCVHCDFTAERAGQIRPHLKTHTVVLKETKNEQIHKLLQMLKQYDKVVAERDKWKRRALEAEKTIALLGAGLEKFRIK